MKNIERAPNNAFDQNGEVILPRTPLPPSQPAATPQTNLPPGIIGGGFLLADNRTSEQKIEDAGNRIDALDQECADLRKKNLDLSHQISQTLANLKDANRRAHTFELELAQARRELAEATQQRDALLAALKKEREAVARFLVPHRHHLAECWLQSFEESGSVRFDEIGFVKAAPIELTKL